MEPVAIVTGLVLVQFMIFGMLVGRARGRAGIKAPAVGGDPVFERHFRAHQNSMEQLVVTVPALWLFGHFVHAGGAALLGIVYLVGRSLYYRAYVADPSRRTAGFVIGMAATAILVLGALAGAAWRWMG